MAPPHNTPICIIGAGVSGIFSALELKRLGYTDVVVLEKESKIHGVVLDGCYRGQKYNLTDNIFSSLHLHTNPWLESLVRKVCDVIPLKVPMLHGYDTTTRKLVPTEIIRKFSPKEIADSFVYGWDLLKKLRASATQPATLGFYEALEKLHPGCGTLSLAQWREQCMPHHAAMAPLLMCVEELLNPVGGGPFAAVPTASLLFSLFADRSPLMVMYASVKLMRAATPAVEAAWAEIQAENLPLAQRAAGEEAAPPASSAHALQQSPFVAPQWTFQELLAAIAASEGIDVRTSHEVVRVSQRGGGGYTVQCRGDGGQAGAEVQCTYLILACLPRFGLAGVDERVAHALAQARATIAPPTAYFSLCVAVRGCDASTRIGYPAALMPAMPAGDACEFACLQVQRPCGPHGAALTLPAGAPRLFVFFFYVSGACGLTACFDRTEALVREWGGTIEGDADEHGSEYWGDEHVSADELAALRKRGLVDAYTWRHWPNLPRAGAGGLDALAKVQGKDGVLLVLEATGFTGWSSMTVASRDIVSHYFK